ncbi:hypothetical protein SP4011_01280 [Streptococcus parapneumoniae]|uniref:DUF7720 domain-containing protein n=1 Tax=Streptococcus parapneumoniae TaxID=2993430 RepID=A0ABN6THE3_9STRE|nr:hypothetical protein SP4011_01280 [Streptococcus sp. SP4011]
MAYSVPILKNVYNLKLLLLLDFKVEDKELLDYLVSTWKYRDLVLHLVEIHKTENLKKNRIKHIILNKYGIIRIIKQWRWL